MVVTMRMLQQRRLAVPQPSTFSGPERTWAQAVADAFDFLPPTSVFSWGNPNSNVSAIPGTIGLNLTSQATSKIWIKQVGSGNTGWASVLTSTVNEALTVSGLLTAIADLEVNDGSDTAPSIAFTNAGQLGVYRVSATEMGLAAAGAQFAAIGSAAFKIPDGSASAPSWTFLQSTQLGAYRVSGTAIGWAASGAQFGEWSTILLSLGIGAGTGNTHQVLRINSGTNSGSNNKDAVVQYQRGGSALWEVGVLGTVATDGAYRWYDSVGATNRLSLTSSGYLVHTAPLRLKNYTVATLPAGTQGDTAFVTDALAPAFLTALVGGGAVVTPAFYDGTNWVAI